MEKKKFEKKIFGLDIQTCSDNTVQFLQEDGKHKGTGNPCATNNIPFWTTQYEGTISSIPSPYARMHVTDLAFKEMAQGHGIFSKDKIAARNNNLSPDYTKALSQCLDIWEMLFLSNELELQEKGITIKKITLHSWKRREGNNELKRLIQDRNNPTNPNAKGSYLQTLDLYRDECLKHINSKYTKFDFTSMYVFKYKGKTFAATSPYTGFFTKADCNLSDSGLTSKLNNDVERNLLTNQAADWCGLSGRSDGFKRFLYLLLKETNLSQVFKNLFEVLKTDQFIMDNVTKLNELVFSEQEEYKRFNIGNDFPLQRIKSDEEVYIRPEGLDSSYLKYLLYIEDAVDLGIGSEEYNKEIDERRFPDSTGKITPWVGVNHILTDALFVLPYEVDDNYEAIPYYDEASGKNLRRCLVPFKSDILQYIPLKDLIDNIKIRKCKEDGHFIVSVAIQLQEGGNVVIRREYRMSKQNERDGYVINPNYLNPFTLGIYPFVKSSVFSGKTPQSDNIYKVLYYNAFAKFSDDAENIKSELIFLYEDNNKYTEFLPTSVNKNITNRFNADWPANTEYFDVHEGVHSIDCVELVVSIGTFTYTSLILPHLKSVDTNPGNVEISIDLGTSNTYIAYQYKGKIQEFSTTHKNGDTQWNELCFMHKECAKQAYPDIDDRNRRDLYLPLESGLNREWISSQLSEFIPTRVSTNDAKNSYTFPIPTIINRLRINGAKSEDYANRTPLLTSSIPFAYYESGDRGEMMDDLSKGQFKWFRTVNKEGDYTTDAEKESSFEMFMEELLFIVRSHMLCEGHNLSSCKLIWTYPLSFDSELVGKYVKAWKEGYRKYFNNEIDNQKIEEWVKYTNESRSPIFECMDDPTSACNLTLLVDVGGGSTDAIGYKDHKPQFISSFEFAGNALYLEGNLNDDPTEIKKNIFRWYLEKEDMKWQDRPSNISKLTTIGKDASVSQIMNYGFSKATEEFDSLFSSAKLQFILQFHNVALVYHIAQMCHILFPNETPEVVYLTGNGSKLMKLNKAKEVLFQKAFKHFYGDKYKEIQLNFQDNPKAATSLGALKGFSKNELAFNKESMSERILMLGDEKEYRRLDPDNSEAIIEADTLNELLQGTKENVTEFVRYFYQNCPAKKPISEDDVIKMIDAVENAVKSKVKEGTIANSLFFYYISFLMEKISYKLYPHNSDE